MSVLNIRDAGVRAAIRAGTAVYIGRGTPWGNPYVLGRDGDRNTVIAKYAQLILDTDPGHDQLSDWLSPLIGKDLVCHCAPQYCHGDVLRILLAGQE